jgi:hypothetical protein
MELGRTQKTQMKSSGKSENPELTSVTENVDEFERISNIRIENWIHRKV